MTECSGWRVPDRRTAHLSKPKQRVPPVLAGGEGVRLLLKMVTDDAERDDLGRLTMTFTGNDTCTGFDGDRGPRVYELSFSYRPSDNITSKTDTVAVYHLGRLGLHVPDRASAPEPLRHRCGRLIPASYDLGDREHGADRGR